jgi:hypothetical protein
MRLLVLLALVAALAAPASQALFGWGLQAQDFAGQGDQTLRAAGYAFSIWGVIYLGLIAYAVYQALPAQSGNPTLAKLRGASAFTIAACGAWICASALNWRWATVVIIVSAATVLTLALARQAAGRKNPRDSAFVWWPLGLLAGWLTIASGINVLTVLTAERLIPAGSPVWAFSGIAAVGLAAISGLHATRLTAYGLPITWGLVAVWVAERHDKPGVALAALAAASLVAALAVWTAWIARAPTANPR